MYFFPKPKKFMKLSDGMAQVLHKVLCKHVLISLSEYNCFKMLCQFLLSNKVNHLYVYIYPHIPSLPPSLSHPSRSSQSTELISLCYVAAFPRDIYLEFGSVYMSMLLSLHPSFPLPTLSPQVHSLCLHNYSCPDTRFISTVFFQIPYICISIRYLFFSF